MTVFTENLNPLRSSNEENLRQIDHYIRYMAERIELSQKKLSRSMTSAGEDTRRQLASLRSSLTSLAVRVGVLETPNMPTFEIDENGHLLMHTN